MSRTQIKLDCRDKQQSSAVIEEILDSHRFDRTSKKGEEYWQQGIGVTQSPKYIRYYFEGDKVVLEGWVTNFGRESDLKGAVGAVPKRSCRKILDEISRAVENANQQPAPQIPEAAAQEVQPDMGDFTVNEETLTDDLFAYLDNNVKSVENAAGQIAPAGNVSQKTPQVSKKSKGIIPRNLRGSTIQNIFEILIALFYIWGAGTGYMVLRFTDSSEALLIVAFIILIHGVLALISNLQDK